MPEIFGRRCRYQQRIAETMAEKVVKILKQSRDARRFRRRYLQNNFFSRENILIRKLSHYISEEYQRKLPLVPHRRIKEIVYNRISGLIKKEDFLTNMSLTVSRRRIGFNPQEAEKLTKYFEKLLIQSVEEESAGH